MSEQYVDGETLRVFSSKDQFAAQYPEWPRHLRGEVVKEDKDGLYILEPGTTTKVRPTMRDKREQVVEISSGATLKSVEAGIAMMRAFLSADSEGRAQIYAVVRIGGRR